MKSSSPTASRFALTRSTRATREHPGPDGGGRGGRGGGGAGGLPARKTTWIENGVVKTLAVDRYWAKKTNVEPVPLSGGLILEGSDKPLEALIAETPRACSSRGSGTFARSTRRTRWPPASPATASG